MQGGISGRCSYGQRSHVLLLTIRSHLERPLLPLAGLTPYRPPITDQADGKSESLSDETVQQYKYLIKPEKSVNHLFSTTVASPASASVSLWLETTVLLWCFPGRAIKSHISTTVHKQVSDWWHYTPALPDSLSWIVRSIHFTCASFSSS